MPKDLGSPDAVAADFLQHVGRMPPVDRFKWQQFRVPDQAFQGSIGRTLDQAFGKMYFHVKYAPETRAKSAGQEEQGEGSVAGRQAIFHRPAVPVSMPSFATLS